MKTTLQKLQLRQNQKLSLKPEEKVVKLRRRKGRLMKKSLKKLKTR